MPKTKAYHPDKNRDVLLPVRTVADIEALPWGGNAWWDCSISTHVEKALLDETIARDVRIAMSERAGYLMTGENCDYSPDFTFETHLQQIRDNTV